MAYQFDRGALLFKLPFAMELSLQNVVAPLSALVVEGSGLKKQSVLYGCFPAELLSSFRCWQELRSQGTHLDRYIEV